MLNKLVRLVKKRKVVGRGGDRGGTSGKGHKGQKARSGGYVRAAFEGGQSPLCRRLPKRGFNNAVFRTEYAVINLDLLERLFETDAEVTKAVLIERGVIKASTALVKVLGRGELTKRLVVHADAFSASAMEKIKGLGGEVTLIA
jgi:large subunit ribosomal protein L15